MNQIAAEIVIEAKHLPYLIKTILRLEGPIRPHTVGEGEDCPAIPVDRLDGQRYYFDRISKNVGFLFFAPRGSFLFSPYRQSDWRVFVSDINETDAIKLMKSVLTVPTLFAFASEWDELVFLNRATIFLPYGNEEAWVGRDLNRYLPGIYWITIIPSCRVSGWNKLTDLSKELDGLAVHRGKENVYIQLHSRASDWKDRRYALRVGEAIEGPIFDKESALACINGDEDFLEISDKLSKWP